MTIDAVESRSDDDTTCSSYNSPVSPSASNDEIRDTGSEKTPRGVVDEAEIFYASDFPSGIAGGQVGTMPTNRSIGGLYMHAIPEQIPEEVETTPSSEESEHSGGSKVTETTVDVSYDGTSNGSGEDTVPSDDDNAYPAAAGRVILGPEGESLAAAPSDDAVVATSTKEDDDAEVAEVAETAKAVGEEKVVPASTMLKNIDDNFVDDQKHRGQQAQSNKLTLAHQQWEDAMVTLKDNPALMTGDILKLSLSHRAPLHVVSFMLGINPDAAGVPSTGPSALQVAVKKRCSLDVIECIIRACPYALFASCDQSYEPLALARIYRREEKALIDLLSLPISYWISNDHGPKIKKSVRFEPLPPCHNSVDPRPPPPPPPAPILKSPSHLISEEKRELSNMKLIVAAIVKSQKKLMVETEVNSVKTMSLAKSEAKTRRKMAEIVDERMKKIAKAHLIAVDMKERAFESKIDSFGKSMSRMFDEAAVRQQRVDNELRECDEKFRKSVEDVISIIVAAADKVEKASASYTKLADLAVKIDTDVIALRIRQDQLEEKIDKVPSYGGCNADVFDEPSFDIESIPETTSTDNLFSDDVECGFDETLIIDSYQIESSFSGDSYQIESSFSSEWNASTQRLVKDEPLFHSSASWWQAVGTARISTKKRRWRRWLKKLG